VLDGSGVIGSEIYNHNSSLFCFVLFFFVLFLTCVSERDGRREGWGNGWDEGHSL